jgi:hypothetical protein
MDNVQNCDSYINIPLSQTLRILFEREKWISRESESTVGHCVTYRQY